MIPSHCSLRTRPRSDGNDRAIVDAYELMELNCLPGIISSAILQAYWRCDRTQVNRRLKAVADLLDWQLIFERGRSACAWLGPKLPSRKSHDPPPATASAPAPARGAHQMKRHRGKRVSITGTIRNLSWHRLESMSKCPWRLEFVLIPDKGQAIASSIDCTASGAVAAIDRQIWENGQRIQVEGHCQGGANGHTQVLVVRFAGRAHD